MPTDTPARRAARRAANLEESRRHYAAQLWRLTAAELRRELDTLTPPIEDLRPIILAEIERRRLT
jgi:hypothetical protein